MARYEKTKRQRRNRKSYYATTIYKKVEEKNSDSYFIAQEGDRCDNLTTNNIPVGTSLRIPANTQDAEGL